MFYLDKPSQYNENMNILYSISTVKKITCIVLIIVFIIFFWCTDLKETQPITYDLLIRKYKSDTSDNQPYILCRNFIIEKLMNSQGGVYTNYLDIPSDELTKGHDVLSESQGILMKYAIETRDQELFDFAWNYAKQYLMTKHHLFAWRMISGEPATSTASIDDLRIAGALYDAAAKFFNANYKKAADKISKALYKYCVSNEILIDGYDFKSNQKIKTIHLCYLELASMKKLSTYDRHWHKIYHKSLAIIQKGKIKNDIPLFQNKYVMETDSFESKDSLDALHSVMILYYLCQTDNHTQEDIDWWKRKLLNGPIYTKYSEEGMAVTNMQSSAIYAFIMLLAQQIEDHELYELSKSFLYKLQITNPISEIYGAFGNEKTLEVYSFDNLLSMWALSFDTF